MAKTLEEINAEIERELRAIGALRALTAASAIVHAAQRELRADHPAWNYLNQVRDDINALASRHHKRVAETPPGETGPAKTLKEWEL